MLAVVVVVGIWQRQYGIALIVRQHVWRYGLLFSNPLYFADKRGYVVGLRHDEHDLHVALVGQHVQKRFQLVARLGVEADKGVVHDEQRRVGKERLCQLELSQLAARQRDDVFVQQCLHVEHAVQMVAQLAAVGIVLAGHQEGFLQQFTDGAGSTVRRR